MEKGILTKETEKILGKKVDDLLELPAWAEAFDGFAATQTIRGLDNHFGDKIPEPYKTELRDKLQLVFEQEDYDQAVKDAFDFLDEVIDVPGIDDQAEQVLFTGLANIIIGVLLNAKK